MSLVSRIVDLATAIGQDVKALQTDVQDLQTAMPQIVVSATEPASPDVGMLWFQPTE